MTVLAFVGRDGPPPHIAAVLSWSGAPDINFELNFDFQGAVVGFTAQTERGLTARDLRKAPIGEMQRTVRGFVADGQRQYRSLSSEEKDALRAENFEAFERLRAMDRIAPFLVDLPAQELDTSSTARKHASIAAAYVELLNAKERYPVKVLAKRLHMGEKTVRNYLFRARETSLLTSAGQGKAGGVLTDKAKEILSGNDQAS